MATLDKRELLEALRTRLRDDLDTLVASQREFQEGATHEEARPEHDKDTRAVEASYVARGLARRVTELQDGLLAVERVPPRAFGEDDPVALGALITLEDEDGRRVRYLFAPAGGGERLRVDGSDEVRVVTPDSPLGEALLGLRLGEDLEVETPQGTREATLVELA